MELSKKKEAVEQLIKAQEKLKNDFEALEDKSFLEEPQWHICKKCEYFSMKGNVITCHKGMKIPGCPIGVGEHSWSVNEPVDLLINCERMFYHKCYENFSQIPYALKNRQTNLVNLICACAKNDYKKVKRLLEFDDSIKLNGSVMCYISPWELVCSPLPTAALFRSKECIKILLEYGADPDIPTENVGGSKSKTPREIAPGLFN